MAQPGLDLVLCGTKWMKLLAAGQWAHELLWMRRCSVQRIAKRAGMLTTCRADQLDAVGFDWTGADALS